MARQKKHAARTRMSLPEPEYVTEAYTYGLFFPTLTPEDAKSLRAILTGLGNPRGAKVVEVHTLDDVHTMRALREGD